jgi:hypothetical protein
MPRPSKRSYASDHEIRELEQQLEDSNRKLALAKTNLRKMEDMWDLCVICVQKIKALAAYGDDGQSDAIGMLGIIAQEAVVKLNRLAEHYPDLPAPFTRNTLVWPAFISHKRSVKKANLELLEKLQVGKAFSSVKWQLDAPSTLWAFIVHSLGLLLVRPRLTASNKKKWFDQAWTSMLQHGFRPEERPELAKLAACKAAKTPKYCKTLRSRTRSANMRAEIKRRVWEAFDHLLTPPRK